MAKTKQAKIKATDKATPVKKPVKPTGRPGRYETAEQLEAAIQAYFEAATPKPIMKENEDGDEVPLLDSKGNVVYTQVCPTMAGLAHALGYVSRQSIYDLGKDERFSYSIKRACLALEAIHEQNLVTRDKPTGDIFWLKNYGWSDKQEIQHTGGISVTLSALDAKL